MNNNDFEKDAIASIKNYLANSYDYNILALRCAKCGSITKLINDDELLTLFHLNNDSLTKLAERLELFHSYANTKLTWLVEDDESLDKLRYDEPKEFFCYAIRELVNVNKYYCQYRHRSNGMLTTEGRYQVNADFSIFCEQFELTIAEQSINVNDFEELNEKLLLMLSIGATSKLESIIKGELSFDWFLSELVSGGLLIKLNKYLNTIINDYKVKHGLAYDHRLTINDVSRISKASRAQALAESKAKTEWIAKLQATKANYFQKVKTSRSGYKSNEVINLMENLIGELMLANNDKSDYLNQLTFKRAKLLVDGKDTTKLNELAKQAIKTRQQVAEQSQSANSLKTITFKFATNKGGNNE